jgi:hypothetical protein
MIPHNNIVRLISLSIFLPVALIYISACKENHETQLSVKIIDKESGLPTQVRLS